MIVSNTHHAPVAQWIEPFDKPVPSEAQRNRGAQDRRLTSNCTEELKILSMGENIVHPLYEVD